MLAVFHLLPVPEIIVQKNSAMTELLTQLADSTILAAGRLDQREETKSRRARQPAASQLRCDRRPS